MLLVYVNLVRVEIKGMFERRFSLATGSHCAYSRRVPYNTCTAGWQRSLELAPMPEAKRPIHIDEHFMYLSSVERRIDPV
jgi:hypothetical protein